MKRLLLILLLLAPSAEAVLISEVMYDLEGKDTKREWVELFSQSEEDLSGWKLYEANTNHRLKLVQGSFLLGAGDFAVIADNNQSFLEDYPDFSGILLDSAFSLSNTGEEISIKDGGGDVVDLLFYSSKQGAAGDGNSLQLVSGEWRACEPTPGAENSCQEEVEVEEELEERSLEVVETFDMEPNEEVELEPEGLLLEDSQGLEGTTSAAVIYDLSSPAETEVAYNSDKQGNMRLPLLILLFVSLLLNVVFIINS